MMRSVQGEAVGASGDQMTQDSERHVTYLGLYLGALGNQLEF